MTEPTDAELLALIEKHLGFKPRRDDTVIDPRTGRFHDVQRYRDMKADILAKWGTPPAVAGQPVAPDFYTACAWHEGGGEAGWIPLPGYSNETEHGVKHLVLEAARKEGYKGTVVGRLLALGWEIRPIYLTQQPIQAQAGAVPLTAEQAQDLIDLESWGPEAISLNAQLLRTIRRTEAAHGIKGGQHGAE